MYMDDHSIIVRAGDLGYRLFVAESSRTRMALGDALSFFLYHYKREHEDELYGFVSYEEYALFQRLISVSGVGPKSALLVLACATPADIIGAIGAGDSSLLKKVSGIGVKTAERIIVELKGVYAGSAAQPSSTISARCDEHDDLIDALIRLGYSRSSAGVVVQSLPANLETMEEKLKYALRSIA